MPKHEPEVMHSIAKGILKSLEEGDRVEREGLLHYCERMMTMCHRAAGKCACDELDRKQRQK